MPSMRPPLISGGNLPADHTFRLFVTPFNEAAADQRRKSIWIV
jgi:hypothetical protein